MEQKHLDEMEEDSFFGEETVDDSDEDYPVLKVEDKPKVKLEKKPMVNKPKVVAASAPIGTKRKEPVDDLFNDDEVQIRPARAEMPVKEVKAAPTFASINNDPDSPKNKENKLSGPAEVRGGVFERASTWKWLAFLLVALLVVSVYTSGFGYEKSSTASGSELSISQAEEKVLKYVNSNLLPAPLAAEVKSKEDIGSLYKIILSVAGQDVDSYVTKDGKLFFPRGFDLNKEVVAESEENKSVVATANTSTITSTVSTVKVNTSVNASTSAAPSASPPPATAPVSSSSKFTITAKKWLFDPNVITVSSGREVQLTVLPLDSVNFTFSIAKLNVEKKISGNTILKFTPSQPGTYEFTCSSCEEWRGMKGTLVVK